MAGQSSKKGRNIPLGGGGQWLELLVTVPASSTDSLAERLIALGSPGIVEDSASKDTRIPEISTEGVSTLIAAFPLDQVSEGLLAAVRQSLDALGPEIAPHTRLAMRLTHGHAWLQRWKQYYRPFKVGGHLVIRPPWEAYTAGPDEVVLTLNPGLAFGTGLHATSQLCLGVLETIARAQGGANLLDVGCGSGILSLTAVLFGFGEAFGVDLDPVAVRVARANARLNQLSKHVTFAPGSLEVVSARFQVIVANILLEPILGMLQDLHNVLAPGGTLILSGILAAEVVQLRRGLAQQRWRLTRQVTQEGWAAIICEEARAACHASSFNQKI